MFIILMLFGNDVIISLKSRPLTFVYLCVYKINSETNRQIRHKKYILSEYLTVDKVGH